MKLAIIHDYLTQMGGAERVVLAMCEAFPDAPVFTSVYSPEGTFAAFRRKDVRVTYLQAAYKIFKNYRALLPFYPRAFRAIDLKGFDAILSSSSAFANGVKKPEGAVQISYCHNTARFIWMKDAYLKEERFNFLKRLYAGLFFNGLKRLDLESAEGVDYFISNSLTVRDRIKRFYGRDSDVLYPPVECERFEASGENDGYYLVVSRLMAHKRIDIAVKAFNRLGVKLKIVGTGPQYRALKEMSSPNIDFLGGVGEEELVRLYSRCAALVYPQEEDLGIAPLEANASGKPVIAFAKGGALETMRPCGNGACGGGTAVFFPRQTPEDLVEAVKRMDHLKFDPASLRENALLFDKSVFIPKLRKRVEEIRGSYGK